MFQDNPHTSKSENTRYLKSTFEEPQSEMHQKFQNPIIKKPAVTRAKRLEQFLWHEFYAEYIRSKERLDAMPSGNEITEYIDEYGKLTNHLVKEQKDSEIVGEMLARDYPLYTNAAISFWNPKGQDNFGKTLSITLPISEQHGQFG